MGSNALLPALGLRMSWPFYCEESTWHRVEQLLPRGFQTVALWISNTQRRVAMWHQRHGQADRGDPIVWDYHVVTAYRSPDQPYWLIEDPSSELDLPSPAQLWLERSFVWSAHLPSEFHPRFRWIPGQDFLREFASNRRHMLDERGRFLRPPPPWPPIGEPGEGSMVDTYSSSSTECAGSLFNLPELLDHLQQTQRKPVQAKIS